jgi:hypothetical protein
MSRELRVRKTAGLALAGILAAIMVFSIAAAAQVETIDATARGTSTQMGKIINVKVNITRYSTPEEKQALVAAFQQGQSQGLAKALEKMKPVGQLRLPGRTGYGLAYVVSIPTDTGRKVRFITTRRIAFGEAAANTRSQSYDLTAGEIVIDDKNPKESKGTLLPATQLIVNKEGNLEWNLFQNPWDLTNIIDWTKGKEK